VTVAGLESADPVECSRQVKVVPDCALTAITDTTAYDVVILPGGMGGAKAFAAVSIGLL
jgi:protein DJ-1